MEYIGEIISGAVLIMVAVIETRASKERKNTQAEKAKAEEREALRAKESQLAMQMQEASLKLSKVTAKKVMNLQTNGDVKEAFDAAEKAGLEYMEFIEAVAAKTIAKK